MIIPFIAHFLLPIALNGAKSISNIAHVLTRVSKAIDQRQRQKRKRNKGYNHTTSVFYIKWDTGM